LLLYPGRCPGLRASAPSGRAASGTFGPPVLKPLAKLEYLIIYTDTESMSVHLINRTLFFKEYKNTSDRIEIYDSVQFCIAIICEKH